MGNNKARYISLQKSLSLIDCDPSIGLEGSSIEEYNRLLEEWQIKAANVYASKRREEDKMVLS